MRIEGQPSGQPNPGQDQIPNATVRQPSNVFAAPRLQSAFRQYTIEPPKFAGEPKEWPTFWMAFDRAVHSQPIPAYEKHICLLQSLVKDSVARKAVDAYPPSDTNYPIVLRILKDQFGDAKALREGLIAELLYLPVADNNLKSLRALREHVERICLQLEAPGSFNPTQDEIVCGIIRAKLPKAALETLLGWEQEALRAWTLRDLRQGLARIVALKERLERTMNTFRPEKPQPKDPKPNVIRDNRRGTDNRRRGVQDERAFAAIAIPTESTQTGQPVRSEGNQTQPSSGAVYNGCSLCSEGKRHKPSDCP
jgi:hypothetical protein